MTLRKQPFENIVGKGENAGNQHFLLFPQCFLPFLLQILVFESHLFCRLQINAFKSDKSKILWLGKELSSTCYNLFQIYSVKKALDASSIGECNTVLSVYTMYRYLKVLHSPICKKFSPMSACIVDFLHIQWPVRFCLLSDKMDFYGSIIS